MSYKQINGSEVPAGVRWHVPRRNQGQIVEVAYGGFGRGEMDAGDPYKRVEDRSEPTDSPERVTYYRWERGA